MEGERILFPVFPVAGPRHSDNEANHSIPIIQKKNNIQVVQP